MKKFVATLLVGLVVALVSNVYAADEKKAPTTKPTASTTSAPASAPAKVAK